MRQHLSTRLAGIAGAVILLLTAAGCGSDDDGDADNEPSTSPSTSEATDEATEPTPPESTDTAPSGLEVFETTVTPAKNVAPGATITATSTEAAPDTAYYCLLSAVTADGSLTASNEASVQLVTASAAGELTCELTYEPFEAPDENGDTRACPPSPADKRAGFQCSVAIADQATVGAKSASVAFFTGSK